MKQNMHKFGAMKRQNFLQWQMVEERATVCFLICTWQHQHDFWIRHVKMSISQKSFKWHLSCAFCSDTILHSFLNVKFGLVASSSSYKFILFLPLKMLNLYLHCLATTKTKKGFDTVKVHTSPQSECLVATRARTWSRLVDTHWRANKRADDFWEGVTWVCPGTTFMTEKKKLQTMAIGVTKVKVNCLKAIVWAITKFLILIAIESWPAAPGWYMTGYDHHNGAQLSYRQAMSSVSPISFLVYLARHTPKATYFISN